MHYQLFSMELFSLSTNESVYVNTSDVTTIIHNFYKIIIDGAAILIRVFWTVIYFVLQGIDKLSSNIILSMKFDTCITRSTQLILNSITQLSISAIYYYAAVRDSVG